MPPFKPNGSSQIYFKYKESSIEIHKNIVWIALARLQLKLSLISQFAQVRGCYLQLVLNHPRRRMTHRHESYLAQSFRVLAMETQRFSTWLVIKSQSGGGHRQHPAFVNGTVLLISRVEVARVITPVDFNSNGRPEERIFETAWEPWKRWKGGGEYIYIYFRLTRCSIEMERRELRDRSFVGPRYEIKYEDTVIEHISHS